MAQAPLEAVVQHIRRLAGRLPEPDTSDGDLLRAFCRRRDEPAFAALLDRHGPMVWAVCRRLLPRRCDAEDAFQATFLVLVRQARSIRKPASVGSWLYGVAARLATRMRLQSAQRHLLETELAHRSETPREASLEELCTVLHEELSQLPVAYRVPLVLCYLESQTQDEAAKAAGLSLRTLKRRLQRGRELLRMRLLRRGVALSAGLLATGLADANVSAGLPTALRQTVVQAASALIQNRGVTAGVVAAQVAVLVNGAPSGIAWSPLKLAAALVVALSVAVAGAGLALHKPAAPEQEPEAAQPASLANLRRDQIPAAELKNAGEGDPANAPAQLVAILGDSRLKHFAFTQAAAFSPDGKTVASASDDGTVCLWDPDTGYPLRRFAVRASSPNQTRLFQCLAVTSDGRTLIAGGLDSAVRFWDVATGQEQSPLECKAWVYALAVSPDGRFLALGLELDAEIWDLKTRTRLHQLAGYANDFRRHFTNEHATVAFSANGKSLLVGHPDGKVRRWDTQTGKLLQTIPAHETSVMSLALSKDGKYLATGSSDKVARLWEVDTGRLLHTLPGHKYAVQAVAFHPNRPLLATGGHEQIKYWNIQTGALEGEWEAGRQVGVLTLAFSPDGRLLASGGPALDLWNAEIRQPHLALPLHRGAPRSLAWSPDGHVLAVGDDDGGVQLWNPLERAVLESFALGNDSVRAVAVSPDGTNLAALDDRKGVERWNLVTKRRLETIEARSMFAGALAWSPDGRWLAIHYVSDLKEDTVKVWDLVNECLHGQFEAGRGVLCFSADSKSLIFAGGGTKSWIASWDVKTLQAGQRVEEPAGLVGIRAACLSKDGRTLALAGNIYDANGFSTQGVVLWDMSRRQPRLFLKHGDTPVAHIAFSPDGRSLVTVAQDNQARVWDPRDGQLRETIRLGGHGLFAVRDVAFAPDSRHFATAMGNGVVYVLRIEPAAETVAEKSEPLLVRKPTGPEPPPWKRLLGKPAPELQQIKGWLAGKPTRLADLRGKHVLLHFWNLHSEADVASLSVLQSMFSDKDLAIVVVYPGFDSTVEQMKKHLAQDVLFGWADREPTFPVALDGGGETVLPTGQRYYGATHAAYHMVDGVRGLRTSGTTLVIDPAGTIVAELPLAGRTLTQSPIVGELQVRLGKEPKLPAVEGRFKEAYCLHDDELFRYVSPPYPRERNDYIVYSMGHWALLGSNGFEYDGHLKFSLGGGITLRSIIATVLALKPYELEGPADLLNQQVKGDWVYRNGASKFLLCREVEAFARDHLQLPITIASHEVERQVLVARGRFLPPPQSSVVQENTVHFYLGAVPPADGSPGTFRSIRELLTDFSDIIREPIINEATETGPLNLKWQNHLPQLFAFDKQKAEKLGAALDHLSQQTGLEFRYERRRVSVWEVRPRH